MKTDLNTEVKIKEAARIVFIRKGMAGARMQEIADKAGINKAMLHYYYRSKEKLFQTIFKEILDAFIPNILESVAIICKRFGKNLAVRNVYNSPRTLFGINPITDFH